jgi:hypothetical protein
LTRSKSNSSLLTAHNPGVRDAYDRRSQRAFSRGTSEPAGGWCVGHRRSLLRQGRRRLGAAYVPRGWRKTFERRGDQLGGHAPVRQRYDFPTGSRLRSAAFTPARGPPGTDADFAKTDLLDRYDITAAVMSSLEAGERNRRALVEDAAQSLRPRAHQVRNPAYGRPGSLGAHGSDRRDAGPRR